MIFFELFDCCKAANGQLVISLILHDVNIIDEDVLKFERSSVLRKLFLNTKQITFKLNNA